MKNSILSFIVCAGILFPVFLNAQQNQIIPEKTSKTENTNWGKISIDIFKNFEIEVEKSKTDDQLLKSTVSSTAINKNDSLALVDLYNSTGGSNWKSKNGWLNERVYDWQGITVENGRVTEIKLVDNNLTGGIPTSIGNLSALTSLDLSENNLTGNIPIEIGNLVNLEGRMKRAGLITWIYARGLDLSENNLTGSIPASLGNLVKTKDLVLRQNNLSGEIPSEIGNLYNTYMLYLDENNFTGSIPPEIGNMSSLITLSLGVNNLSGEIPEELGQLDSLTGFGAPINNLSGTIPPELFYNGRLVSLVLARNDLEGPLPASMSIPYFGSLLLSSNKLSDLPYISIFYDLPWGMKPAVSLDSNRFTFNDLEQLTDFELTQFVYAPQDTITIEKNTVENATELSMDAGGTQTTYQWFYDSVKVTGAVEKKYTVPSNKEYQKYHCEATNSLLPDLTLLGSLPEEERNCWETGTLKFCLTKGNWEKASDENKIKASDIVSINDFLYFDGTITIDTVALEIDANGEFYVQDIPLVGGSIGKYTLAVGGYNLKLLGEDGQITNFLNSNLEKSGEIFGVDLKIDDLQLVNKSDTIGLKIGCSIKVPGIMGGCGTTSKKETEIKLDGLEITSAGISLGGVAVKDMGLFAPGFCLKELGLSYDGDKDILTAGMNLEMPIGEIGGGFKIEKGSLDSIGWKIESNVAPFVLGTTTIGVKGFFGHISSITKPAMEVELGGIFSDIIVDDLYRFTLSGTMVWPATIGLKGTVQFLRPVFDDLPYQLKGNADVAWDVANDLFKIDFGGSFGTIDETEWLMTGNGKFRISFKKSPSIFTGRMNGNMALKKIPENSMLSFFNYIVDLPFEVKAADNFIWGKNKVAFGECMLRYGNWGPYKLKYVKDLSLNYNHEDYFVWSVDVEKTKSAVISEKSAFLDGNVTQTFVVPENNEYGVIEVRSLEQAPVSTISSPLGKTYSESSSDDNVLYVESPDKKSAFWAIIEPQPGSWEITLENPAEKDSVITQFQLQDPEFQFSVTQTGNTVNVHWDVSQVKDGQTINLILDDDKADFDGFRIADGDATLGNLSFTLDENTPDCQYYLFAQLIDEFSVVETYAENTIENPLATLAPPKNLTSVYNSGSGEFEFSWDVNSLPTVAGTIFTVTDPSGKDSVYAILDNNQSSISLYIEDYFNKTVKIESYNQDWKTGCPSTPVRLLTSIGNNTPIEERFNKLNVYPNPTNGNCVIRYFVSEPSDCEIRIFDIQGKQIAQPLFEFKTAGFHQFDFKYDNLPNGIYLIKYINKKESFTVKSVLSK